MNEELQALTRIVIAGGPIRPRRRLLEIHGTAQKAIAAGMAAWKAAGLQETQIHRLHHPNPRMWEVVANWLEDPTHRLIGWHDVDYPPLLRHISSPPLALFVQGDPFLLWNPGIAIVGSRTPSPAGLDNAHEFSVTLAAKGFVIISGLAAGIDAAAHHAALANASMGTIAVLGTGPDGVYPKSNQRLKDKIVENGAIVTEYLPGTPPKALHFPQRNRIVAGLSLGTVVIEASSRSGALITARLAAENGREVFALPGSIRNARAQGCHRLIRQGASLVESPEEIVQGIMPLAATLADTLRHALKPSPVSPSPVRREISSGFSKEADGCHQLLACLGDDATTLDILAERSGLTIPQLSSMLLQMELNGLIVVEHGRYWRKHR